MSVASKAMRRVGLAALLCSATLGAAALAQGFVPVPPDQIELRFSLPSAVSPLMTQTGQMPSATRPRPRPETLSVETVADLPPEVRPLRPRIRPAELIPIEAAQTGQSETLLPKVADAGPDIFTPAPPQIVKRALPALLTATYRQEDFLTEKLRLQQLYVQSDGDDKISAALALSKLYLAHMLLVEARDFHRAAQGLGVQNHARLYDEWRVQTVMLDVLQQKPISLTLPEGWEDVSLWIMAAHADPADFGGEADLLTAVNDLQNHSEPVISRLLPMLFDKAMRQGELRIADGLLRGAREATTLVHQPIFELMMGRLALAYDMPQEAFDHFAKAAMGRDISAQHARIAMADIALDRKDPKLLPDLRDILLEGVEQWRHGREGLILRARLAQVAEDLGDIPLALDIMGSIRQDHPGTPEAILAHERGALALAAFAVAMDADEIGLETYLHSLRRVEAFYRLDPVWPIARSALGRAFGRLGLYEAEAAEYAALGLDLQRLGAPVPPERQRIAIPLSEAEARLKNNDISRAKIALAREGLPRFEELVPRYNMAALRAGLPGALDFPPQDLNDLVEYAGIARREGALEQAAEAHRRLSDAGVLADNTAEALEASLLAYQRKDLGFAAAGYFALQEKPAGRASAITPPLFEALATPMPDLMPLSQVRAHEMLNRSQAALEASKALLARPLMNDSLGAKASNTRFTPIEGP